MSFVIKKNSQSFKYLSYWKSNYEKFAMDGQRSTHWGSRNIANDFCSYYRTVLTLMFQHFLIGLLAPSFLTLVLILTGAMHLSPNPTLASGILLIFSLYSAAAMILLIVLLMVWFQNEVWPRIVDGIRYMLPERKQKKSITKEPKQPNVLAVWYDSFKGKYCPTINYEIESHDQVVHTE